MGRGFGFGDGVKWNVAVLASVGDSRNGTGFWHDKCVTQSLAWKSISRDILTPRQVYRPIVLRFLGPIFSFNMTFW